MKNVILLCCVAILSAPAFAQDAAPSTSDANDVAAVKAVRHEKLERLKSERDSAEAALIDSVEIGGWLSVIDLVGVSTSCCGLGLMLGGFGAGGSSNIYYSSGASLVGIGALTVAGSYLWRVLVLDVDEKERNYKAKRQEFDREAMAF